MYHLDSFFYLDYISFLFLILETAILLCFSTSPIGSCSVLSVLIPDRQIKFFIFSLSLWDRVKQCLWTLPTNSWWFLLLRHASLPPPVSSFIKGNGSDNHFQTGSILDHQCVGSPQAVALLQPSILIASSADNYSHRSARKSEQIKAKLDYECNAV